MSNDADIDSQVLKLSLDIMTSHVNKFLEECVAEDGSVKAPSKKALMRLRGLLPPQHSMSLQKKAS